MCRGKLLLSLTMLTLAAWHPTLAQTSALSQAHPQTPATLAELRAGFANPPAAARLRCYWWWLNGHTDEPTITHDLEEMKAKGFGGALLVDANGADQDGNQSVPAGPVFGSPAWTRLYLHALHEADRLGLELTLNITSGWNLGGPSVTPEQASKVLTWSRQQVLGGASVATTSAAASDDQRLLPSHRGARVPAASWRGAAAAVTQSLSGVSLRRAGDRLQHAGQPPPSQRHRAG